MAAKERLDVLVHEQGLAESREQAKRLILAGAIMVEGQPHHKPGHRFDRALAITRKEGQRYVGRGGLKLDAAFAAFPIDVADRVCLDVGASTGGFTDCMLQRGARQVYCVDVGHGQLHWKLRNDPRVIVHEKMNARRLDPSIFDPRPDFATVDVSFISLEKVLGPLVACMKKPYEVVSLVKPQFEAGREQVEKGGVVRDNAVRQATADRIKAHIEQELGAIWRGCIECPVHGPAGNVEYLAWWSGC